MGALTPYIAPAEYAVYGIGEASFPLVNAACRLVDGYLGRPEGLLWSPDANGQPAWMTGKTPSRSYTLASDIVAGSGVAITIPFAAFGFQTVGEVAILDRSNPAAAEACIVAAASGTAITLSGVQFDHAAGATVEFGLTIAEELSLRYSSMRTSRSPVANIFCGFGRYGYSRELGRLDDYEALLVTNYGQNGASGWNALDITGWDLNRGTGVISTRGGATEIRLHYIAGWDRASLPEAIKQAVANIVRARLDGEVGGNVKLLKAGDATIERFGPSTLDLDTKALLQPYRQVRFG